MTTHHTAAAPAPHDVRNLAAALLATAAEVEAAETRIKQEILIAAGQGDCARVIEIVNRWRSMPATEVLAPAAKASKTRAKSPRSPLIDAESHGTS